jgi:hypothetical protein
MLWKDGGRICALASALTLAGCVTASAPPPGPTAGLRIPAPLAAQAGVFAGYARKASAMPASFSGPEAVGEGLAAGAAYEPKQLEAGLVAFTAVAALQDPAFVNGVKRAGRDKSLGRRLAARPETALTLPGAAGAADRARAALMRQSFLLTGRGQAIKAASYTVQRKAWARAKVADPSGRLSRVKAISRAVYHSDGDDQAQLYRAVADAGSRGGGSSAVMSRGLAAAALTVLGDPRGAAGLLSEPKSGSCLRLAKLNLYQCLASAGPYYEDIYCLGQHALIETGQCVAEAAGASRPGKGVRG